MIYFDTSFLAPLFRTEATTARVASFIAALPPSELTISRWTAVEMASVLARDVRMGVLPAASAAQARAMFKTTVASFAALLPSAADYELAEDYLDRYDTSLRGGDALHLAVAANNRATAIHSLDQGMIKAGQLLGLPVSMGIAAN